MFGTELIDHSREKLTERELCELTGVSRPLMREAMRDLEAPGLISNVPHKGPTVAMLTRNDARARAIPT